MRVWLAVNNNCCPSGVHMTKCQCPTHGWCPTHKREMHAVQHNECRNRPGYFDAYNKGARQRGTRGLGDVVAAVTQLTGVEQIAKAITRWTSRDCGCKQRQEWLNSKFPNKTKTGPS